MLPISKFIACRFELQLIFILILRVCQPMIHARSFSKRKVFVFVELNFQQKNSRRKPMIRRVDHFQSIMLACHFSVTTCPVCSSLTSHPINESISIFLISLQ